MSRSTRALNICSQSPAASLSSNPCLSRRRRVPPSECSHLRLFSAPHLPVLAAHLPPSLWSAGVGVAWVEGVVAWCLLSPLVELSSSCAAKGARTLGPCPLASRCPATSTARRLTHTLSVFPSTLLQHHHNSTALSCPSTWLTSVTTSVSDPALLAVGPGLPVARAAATHHAAALAAVTSTAATTVAHVHQEELPQEDLRLTPHRTASHVPRRSAALNLDRTRKP